jgi:hypothetical protein
MMVCACGLLRAQNFDAANGNAPLLSLDGLWRFHAGDDPAWAQPGFDDSGWSLLRSDRDWYTQGYKGYGGMGWYWFHVTAGLAAAAQSFGQEDDITVLTVAKSGAPA